MVDDKCAVEGLEALEWEAMVVSVGGFGSGAWRPGLRLQELAEAKPRTSLKLGHLVKDMKIKSLKEIYFFFLPIRLSEIINF